VTDLWESRLGLGPGEINKRMHDIWEGGGIGAVSEHDVHQAARERLGLDEPRLEEFIYALACERLQVKPAQIVFLDDYEPCVEGARRAGIHAVLYQDNAQAVRDIERLLAP
jgi:putative hydrolase of the HAD superfamily